MNVFFDVQGTLLASGVPRPHAREVFVELGSLGHDVYLWSSAGAGYATRAAQALGVEDLVLGCYSKHAPPPVSVDYVVDDFPRTPSGKVQKFVVRQRVREGTLG